MSEDILVFKGKDSNISETFPIFLKGGVSCED